MKKNLSLPRLTKLCLLSVALLFAGSVKAMAQGSALALTDLGNGQTIVKATQQRYILLPIEEQAPEAVVKVIVNNCCEQSLNVRLALNKVDYYVPFDLSLFGDKKVALLVEMPNEQAKNNAEQLWVKTIKTSDTFDTTNKEKYRPLFHHTPEYGWMNDPNGMFYKDGEWHLCYQHNLYGSTWGNMSWGHAVSRDLINWKQLPTAIDQDAWGTIFSGSSVVDTHNTAGFGEGAIVSIFTSAGKQQIQSMAYSTDGGKSFKKYADNPVLALNMECRDPNMFWNEQTGRWTLLLANALGHEMLIYSSADLKTWTKESAFGKGYGCQDGVWECPDLLQLPVRGTKEKKWVLICNINPGGPYGGSATQYFVGNFDGKQFTCDDKPEVTKWMDYGKDHYATVSWSNQPKDRTVVMGWMSNWQYAAVVPTMQYRSANTLPRTLELYKGEDGSYYVASTPVKEIEAKRDEAIRYGSFVAQQQGVSKALPTLNDGICEINISIKGSSNQKIDITLSNEKGNRVVMTYDMKQHTFSMNRKESGIVNFNADFPAITSVKLPRAKEQAQTLRLFIDRCSIEAFEGQGRFAMTNLVFPETPYTTLSIQPEKGSCKVSDLTIYPINPKK